MNYAIVALNPDVHGTKCFIYQVMKFLGDQNNNSCYQKGPQKQKDFHSSDHVITVISLNYGTLTLPIIAYPHI